jgi:micrococcal nuclease
MGIMLVIIVVLMWSPHALAAGSAARPEAKVVIATAVVAEVSDGNTILLESPVTGISGINSPFLASRVLRLAGIEAPHSAKGNEDGKEDGADGDESWPLAEDARRALATLALGHRLRLSIEGLALDRYRRLIAHAHLAHADIAHAGLEGSHQQPASRETGTWLQAVMLARGMARVRSLADNRSRVAEMLAIEGEARANKRGIWAHPFYRIRTVGEAEGDIDSFQIVEGIVLDRARVRDRIYLNFGPDWRTDFTVSIETRLLPAFEDHGLDPMELKGRRIRVRGWIQSRNGPLIEATHPEQIEVLPDAAPGS